MFWFKCLLPIFACLGLTAAGHCPEKRRSWIIIQELDFLRNETQQLSHVLTQWDKTLFGGFGVALQSHQVLVTTQNATADIKINSRRLGIFGALHVKQITKKLLKDIQNSTTILTDMRKDFGKIGAAESVMENLIDQQRASQAMNEAIVPKLPYILRGIGRRLGRKIFNTFQRAIDVYADMVKEFPAAEDKPC